MLSSKMSEMSANKISIFICLIVACVLKINAVPLKNTPPHKIGHRNASKVDMSSEYAKQVLRLAKAAEINSNLNSKIDPCDDFYKYACGHWDQGNPAHFFKDLMTDRFQEISKAFNRRFVNLINESEDDSEIGNNVKIFYRACKIARADELQYKLSLQKVYKEFGNWSGLVDENWNEPDFKWWETVARIQHKYGKKIILSVDIMGDIKNKTESRIYLGPPDYSNSSEGSKFVAFILKENLIDELMSQFDIDHKLAKKTADELNAFETKLSNSGIDSSAGLDFQDMIDLKNLEALDEEYKENFDIKRYLELVLDGKPPESIYMYDESYIINALDIIESTPKYIVANYILWQLLSNFYVKTDGDKLNWCVDKTKSYFGKYVDKWVYSYYRDEKEEIAVTEVFEDIRSTFREALKGNKLDWISNSTRELAIVKLDAMKLIISSYEKENYTEEYGNLQLDPYSYIENVRNFLMQDSINELKKLNESNIGAPEDAAVLSFTPSYQILENTIKIPVAFLQPRHFWSTDYPMAIKYATLGYLIAHEIVHGFDDDGRKFDKDGMAFSWWDPKSTYEFEERRKCFQAQYHSYKYGGKALPESILQSENIADNAGVKLAYEAYQRWLNSEQKNNPEIEAKEVLPGLPLNNRQLFFVSFAQVWCEDVQFLFKSTITESDNHAPGMYRVIGSLSNFQEFSWVFQCSQDAKMDPEYKCSIF